MSLDDFEELEYMPELELDENFEFTATQSEFTDAVEKGYSDASFQRCSR